MSQDKITDSEFKAIRDFLYDYVGINLSSEKKALVTSRLGKRLRHHSLDSFKAYFDLMMSPHNGERQIAIDLLTTNETYFFREPKHFVFLENEILPEWSGGRTFRVWSAASSTGEEAYSLAMLLDDRLGRHPWEVFGSDISSRVLEKAKSGLYQQDRIEGIPKPYLQKYCLKGVGENEGKLLIDKKLRQKVSFAQVNLKRLTDELELFDVIFLRNVMIYFDLETKRQIVKQLIGKLRLGGYLFIGHSESLKGINDELETALPTVYRKIKNR